MAFLPMWFSASVEADRRRGLALAGGVGEIADQDQLAVRACPQRLDVVHRHLGLVVAVGLA